MRPLDGLIHYILEHGAHHVNMGIPLYRLKEAQARLTATLDERLNSEVFTWRYYWNTVRRCKLYDFAQHVWTGLRRAHHLRAVWSASVPLHSELRPDSGERPQRSAAGIRPGSGSAD